MWDRKIILVYTYVGRQRVFSRVTASEIADNN